MQSKIEQYLKENQIEYQGIAHAPAASAEEYNRTLNTRYEQQVKVLLVSYKKDGDKKYIAVAIQGHKKVDLNKIQELLGASKIRMADRDQLKEVTGCNFGELHPFAKVFNLQLLMDKDLLNENQVYFNAGCLEYSIALNPKTIQQLETPMLF